MALLQCDFFSECLGVSTAMTVLLPQRTTTQIGLTGTAPTGPPPVLYLLHGLSDDETIWLRRTSIERYAAQLGLAVVMPRAEHSFYTDEYHGRRYWQFLTRELPEIVGSLLRVSPRRQDTFVAGLSMGGYGALKWALREPGRFAAAASLSGALDVARLRREAAHTADAEYQRFWNRIFGDRTVEGSDDDLFALLDRPGELRRSDEFQRPADQHRPAGGRLPELYVGCGTADMLVEHSLRFVEVAKARGIDVRTSFSHGEHEWGYWDREIQAVLDWLPLPDRTAHRT